VVHSKKARREKRERERYYQVEREREREREKRAFEIIRERQSFRDNEESNADQQHSRGQREDGEGGHSLLLWLLLSAPVRSELELYL
jgi:bisphosphoglycerate-independent phosphoglycerate mutase (AlkP superfamily)